MYLDNYQYLKNKNAYLLIFLFIFSFLIRIPVIFVSGDITIENEWKTIVENLVTYKKLSLISFGDFFVPSVFMPPLYAFYLFFFKIFNFSDEIYIQVVLLSQILLSSISVVIFYKINSLFFSNKVSILGTLIFSLFPLHIFACGQISSIILQLFLTILFFYYFLQIVKNKNFLNIFILSVISGLLILLRGEFIVLFFLSILYLFIFLKINIKKILLIVFLTTIIISPYLIRNILVVETITITKSFGFNLWKGNHPTTKVEGNADYFYNSNLKQKIDELPKDKYYHINFDNVFLNEGIKNIKSDPLKYIKLYISKILSFIFIDLDSSSPNYYHPLHYLPVLVVSIISIFGLILSNKKSFKINFFILFFFSQVALMSIFFILPRYKLTIIPLQIIFANIFFEYVKNNLIRLIK